MMTLAQRIRLILDGDTSAMFARGGGGSKSAKGKGSKSKKAKGATQAGSGGACCKAEGGKFAPGNNYGSLAGKGNSQRAAANRVKARLAAKGREATLRKAAEDTAKRPTPAGVKGIAARSKAATVAAARVQAAKDTAALEKKQAKNAKVREKRAAKKAEAKPKTEAVKHATKAPGRGTDDRQQYAGVLKATRQKTDSPTGFVNRLSGGENNRSESAGKRYIEKHGGVLLSQSKDAQGRPVRNYEVIVGGKRILATYKPLLTTNPRVQVMGYTARVTGTAGPGAKPGDGFVARKPTATINSAASDQPLTSTKADRAASLKRLTDRSRVASGKAGAKNAMQKRDKEFDALIAKQDARKAAEAPERAAAIKAAKAERAKERRDKARRIAEAPPSTPSQRQAIQSVHRAAAMKSPGAASAAAKPVTPVKPPPASVRSVADSVRAAKGAPERRARAILRKADAEVFRLKQAEAEAKVRVKALSKKVAGLDAEDKLRAISIKFHRAIKRRDRVERQLLRFT